MEKKEVVYKVDRTAGGCSCCHRWRWLDFRRENNKKLCNDCVTTLILSNVIAPPLPLPELPNAVSGEKKRKCKKTELPNAVSGEKTRKCKKKETLSEKEETLSEKEQRIIQILQNSDNPLFATEILIKLGIDNNRIELQKVQRLCIKLKNKKKIAISEYHRRRYIDIERESLLLVNVLSQFQPPEVPINPSSISKVYDDLQSATKALSRKDMKSGLERQTLAKVLKFLIGNGTVESYIESKSRRRLFYALKSNKRAMKDLALMREQSVDRKIVEIIKTNKQVTLGKITNLMGLRSHGGKSIKKRLTELLSLGIISREPRILDPTSKVKSFFYFVKKDFSY